ncbi:hypothetical protein LCGC14_1476830 [marine sediment metagenome]|uniref:N-acetylmuramoyl-L-alanine amidase n=1 Tax=marine sediment metagenome TaxID=412755 RepID=A0A0F9JAQ9_9ZZZZ
MAKYPGAIWRPTNKYGYTSTNVHTKGVVCVIIHSAEGYRAGMFSVLDGPRQSSWHFSVMKNGEVYQHISTGNIAWTSGSFEANDGSIQLEEEGKTGEALTNSQYASTIALLLWVFRGYRLGEPSRKTNLREHNEFYNTSCPSNRVPWKKIIVDLTEEDMTPEEIQKALDLVLSSKASEFREWCRRGARDAIDDKLNAIAAAVSADGGISFSEAVAAVKRANKEGTG